VIDRQSEVDLEVVIRGQRRGRKRPWRLCPWYLRDPRNKDEDVDYRGCIIGEWVVFGMLLWEDHSLLIGMCGKFSLVLIYHFLGRPRMDRKNGR
jgi:hypothetical protein